MTKPKLTYWQQLQHPNWQRVRLQMLEQADFTCEFCGAEEDQLHVHHKHYVKGRMAWEYSNKELEVLCNSCHEYAHQIKDKLSEVVAELPLDFHAGILNHILGMHGHMLDMTKYEDVYHEYQFLCGDISSRFPSVFSVENLREFLSKLESRNKAEPFITLPVRTPNNG